MDWSDRQFLKEFMCEHTKITYNQVKRYEVIGKDDWEETITWNFECNVLPFEDHGNFMVHHELPQDPDRAVGVFKNTDKSASRIESVPDEDLRTLEFR